MPRRVEIAVQPQTTGPLVDAIAGLPGLLGLRVQQGVSRLPPGDVVTVEITNRGLHELVRLLDGHGVGSSPAGSYSTSEPVGIVSASSAAEIVTDSSEATWEEMEVVIGKNSNMTVNAFLVMSISGVLAVVGIATDALHLVLGAMLIAPGFQPIVRIALGVVSGGGAWRRGIAHTLQGYLTLVAGAAAAALLLQALGRSPLGTEGSYLPAGVLISYWTTIAVPSVIVSVVAAAAGAILIATDRAVLTAGVMVALALVPGAAITAIGLVAGEYAVAASGLVRWLMEVGVVLLVSLMVLQWKRSRLHRRRARL
jgi:hypothetical protein